MRIFAVDPGLSQSGWVLLRPEDRSLIESGIDANEVMRRRLHLLSYTSTRVVIEHVGHYGTGMSVGKDVFDTCVWIGRFVEICEAQRMGYTLIERRWVKIAICASAKAKDKNIRQAMLDRYPATGGGSVPQVGTKGKPGPLFGVSSHIWPALALAHTYLDQLEGK